MARLRSLRELRGHSEFVEWLSCLRFAGTVRAAPQSPVTRAYAQLTARLGWRVARVAAARKLLRIVYSMLRRGAPWRGAGRVEADVRDRSTPNMSLDDRNALD